LASELLTNRRQFVLAGASLAVVPWLGSLAQGAVRRKTTFSVDPFALGVASGDPAADGVVLWTRLTQAPLEGGGMPPEAFEVTWEVAKDDSMREVVQRGVELATPQLAHSVHVELRGLEPNRPYWYRFSVGDAQSPIGRTRTAPAADAQLDKLRFAFASCQHYETGLYTAYEHMCRDDVDLVVHLGDYIYDQASTDGRVRKHVGPELNTLEHYRNRYGQYKSDEHLRAMHTLAPWLVVWDDHEFDNNCAGCFCEDPQVSMEEFLLRRANAYQAYYEHMPLRRRHLPKGSDMRLYRRVNYGRLAEFQMLDTRQYRSDQPNGDGRKPLTGDAISPKATMLGPEQERWLANSLLQSTSRWNVLAQQVMMGRANRDSKESPLYSMDQWAGYDVPRRRLLEYLASRQISNPVVLTGDIHSNWVNDLKVDFDRSDDRTVATEFVGTSISSGGNGRARPKNHDEILANNPFVRFHNTERGYVRCTVTPYEWRSDYQVVEYIDRPGAPAITRASFVVENGRPGAVEA
jgi:alkaline phosphatase D